MCRMKFSYCFSVRITPIGWPVQNIIPSRTLQVSGAGFTSNLFNSKPGQYVLKPRYSDSYFTGDALAAGGAR